MRRIRVLLVSVCWVLWATMAGAQQTQERFWVLWEHIEQTGSNCPNASTCNERRTYASRLFNPQNRENIYRLFGMLDFQAAVRGQKADHPDAPRICQHHDPEVVLGFDPEVLPLSEKLDALRGLKGVALDITRLKAPQGYEGNFGAKLQVAFEERFKQAGIAILSEEERLNAPGQPKLNIYFSNTNRATGCTYSVFASLSQTVLLTRNLQIKRAAGTWSFSTGPSQDFPNAVEYDAILRVADAFVRDFKMAQTK